MIKLHEDFHVEGSGALADHLRSVFTYKGAALTVEGVQERIDSGVKLDVYKYEIVNGEVVAKDGSPFFIKDPNWISPKFDPRTATIRWGSETITPETPLTDYPADIQAFVQAIYTFNDNEQTKIWNALQVEVIEPDRHPEPLTPEQEKELARRQIIQEFDNGVKALTSGYTDNEVKSWDAKRRESEIILSGSDEPTPIIDAIVEGLSVDRNQFAKLIDQKAKQYGAAYGKLEAKMKRDLAALEE